MNDESITKLALLFLAFYIVAGIASDVVTAYTETLQQPKTVVCPYCQKTIDIHNQSENNDEKR